MFKKLANVNEIIIVFCKIIQDARAKKSRRDYNINEFEC
jgi:hypothetical protein